MIDILRAFKVKESITVSQKAICVKSSREHAMHYSEALDNAISLLAEFDRKRVSSAEDLRALKAELSKDDVMTCLMTSSKGFTVLIDSTGELLGSYTHPNLPESEAQS